MKASVFRRWLETLGVTPPEQTTLLKGGFDFRLLKLSEDKRKRFMRLCPMQGIGRAEAAKVVGMPGYGLAFERLCAAPIDQIRQALGISGVSTSVHGWRSSHAVSGVQIDLIIKRADNIIDLCETKFTAKSL